MTRAAIAVSIVSTLLAETAAVSVSLPAYGQQAGLDGSWNGSGRITLPRELQKARVAGRPFDGNPAPQLA